MDNTRTVSREAEVCAWIEAVEPLLTGRGQGTSLMAVRVENRRDLEESFGEDKVQDALSDLTKRLEGLVDSSYSLSQWSAGEVAILPRRVVSLKTARRLAAAIRQTVDTPSLVWRGSFQPLIATGAVRVDQEMLESPGEVLRRLDEALRRAAQSGDGRFAVYDHRRPGAAIDRSALHESLRNAVDQELLSLVYQPIIDLSSGKVAGVEALSRWSDERLGDIPPTVFVPAAQEIGVADRLERWVVETACRNFGELRSKGQFDLLLSVNVTANQFGAREFALEGALLKALDSHGIPPTVLQVEITERAVAPENDRHVLRSIQRMSQMGTRFVIDDFGTGYSSLSRLHRLPVSGIKIDEAFVSSLDGNADLRKIVSAIVSLSRDLGLEVTAEGIERKTQRSLLTEFGCQFGQGYLLGRPMSAPQVTELLLADEGETVSGPRALDEGTRFDQDGREST